MLDGGGGEGEEGKGRRGAGNWRRRLDAAVAFHPLDGDIDLVTEGIFAAYLICEKFMNYHVEAQHHEDAAAAAWRREKNRQ